MRRQAQVRAIASRPTALSTGQACTVKEYGGSATIMHKPTGLYVYGAYGQKHDEDRFDLVGLGPNRQVDKDDRVWYIQPGIEKKWLPARHHDDLRHLPSG